MRVKSIIGALLLATALPAAGSDESHGDARYRDEQTTRDVLSFGASEGTRRVVVDNVWGPVTVRVHGADDVAVTVHRSLRAGSEVELEEARREARLDVTAEAGLIELYVDGPFRWDERRDRARRRDVEWQAHYTFDLAVPADVDLELRTVLDGDIRVEGVTGRLALFNVVDDVVAVDVGGEGRMESVSGDVEAGFGSSPSGGWSFETVSGDIDVTLPATASADARFASQWGEMYSDFPVELVPTRPVARKVSGGRWSLETDGSTVRLGAGGPLIAFESVSGDVYLRKGRS